MRVLVLGGEGMLGHKVYQVLGERFETFATFVSSQGPWAELPMYAGSGRTVPGVNALDLQSMVRAFAKVKPDVVVNCIGIVKQLEEAQDAILTIRVNSLFPHQLAELCAAARARMFHFSTDCVFTGTKGKYTEADPPDARDLYGRTKMLGEVDRPGCVTLRTSIIGRDFFKQTGLLEWFLSHREGRVNGFKNAIWSGFTTNALARIVGDIIEEHPQLSGVYQVASEPISKYELLCRIKLAMDLAVAVEPYDDPPCDRSLSPARLVADTGCRLPTWDEMIVGLAADPTPYDDWREKNAT